MNTEAIYNDLEAQTAALAAEYRQWLHNRQAAFALGQLVAQAPQGAPAGAVTIANRYFGAQTKFELADRVPGFLLRADEVLAGLESLAPDSLDAAQGVPVLTPLPRMGDAPIAGEPGAPVAPAPQLVGQIVMFGRTLLSWAGVASLGAMLADLTRELRSDNAATARELRELANECNNDPRCLRYATAAASALQRRPAVELGGSTAGFGIGAFALGAIAGVGIYRALKSAL